MKRLLNFFSRFRTRLIRRKRKGYKEPLLKSDMLNRLDHYKGTSAREYALNSELWRMQIYEEDLTGGEYLLRKVRMKREPRRKKS